MSGLAVWCSVWSGTARQGKDFFNRTNTVGSGDAGLCLARQGKDFLPYNSGAVRQC